MWRELIITDVTRMSGDKVCVGGVDHDGNNLRPLLPYPDKLLEQHLYDDEEEVMIRPRAVLNMYLEPKSNCKPPHTEDCMWTDLNRIECLRLSDDTAWRTVLERTASDSVAEIFEAEIYKNKRVAPETGVRSLGTIQPQSINTFTYYRPKHDDEGNYKYRLSFTDAASESYYQLPVTDLSLRYYVDYLRVRDGWHSRKIKYMLEHRFQYSEVWLRLGLTRPFQRSDEDAPWCYIQVTGIYTFPDYLDGACFADYRM